MSQPQPLFTVQDYTTRGMTDSSQHNWPWKHLLPNQDRQLQGCSINHSYCILSSSMQLLPFFTEEARVVQQHKHPELSAKYKRRAEENTYCSACFSLILVEMYHQSFILSSCSPSASGLQVMWTPLCSFSAIQIHSSLLKQRWVEALKLWWSRVTETVFGKDACFAADFFKLISLLCIMN